MVGRKLKGFDDWVIPGDNTTRNTVDFNAKPADYSFSAGIFGGIGESTFFFTTSTYIDTVSGWRVYDRVLHAPGAVGLGTCEHDAVGRFSALLFNSDGSLNQAFKVSCYCVQD